jgi:hypothetical protein
VCREGVSSAGVVVAHSDTVAEALHPGSDSPLVLGNYAVCFIDLLGQRDALRGQHLLPKAESEEEKQQLIAIIKESVGSIAALQRHALEMIRSSEPNPTSPLRAQLSPEQQKTWDEMQRTKVTTQNWSDGLMLFSNLGDSEVKCQMNNVYRLFTLAGALCFIGLASRRPLRGAIEVAWGVELNPGELYGAAVARAYELESEVADYPRIVVGPELIRFIDIQAANPGTSQHDQVNKALAAICTSMLVQDADGHWLVHYLGRAFADGVSQASHADLYQKALAYIRDQISTHQSKKNGKLAFRYVHLHQYFAAHSADNSKGSK